MAEVHSFRLGKKDLEFGYILNSMSGREKGDFIRKALYFYIRYGDKINKIDDIYSGIKEIINRLDGMSVGQSICSERKNDENTEGESERILRESVNLQGM